jgi:YggT family protein
VVNAPTAAYTMTRATLKSKYKIAVDTYPEKETDPSMYLLIATLATFIQIYSTLLIIRVLLTWFPNINWYNQPFAALSQITDPYLNIFRNIIPPLGGMDFSPILAFVVLNIVSNLLYSLRGLPLLG